MTAGSTWLGLAGLAIIGVLMHRQVKVRHSLPYMHAKIWGTGVGGGSYAPYPACMQEFGVGWSCGV